MFTLDVGVASQPFARNIARLRVIQNIGLKSKNLESALDGGSGVLQKGTSLAEFDTLETSPVWYAVCYLIRVSFYTCSRSVAGTRCFGGLQPI